MDVLSAIASVAEQKIEEAIAEGQFDALPGMGKPLELENLSHLPADMRMAYTILKNSGYLSATPEKNKAASMRDLLAEADDEQTCYARMQKLKVMMNRVQSAKPSIDPAVKTGTSTPAISESSPYFGKLLSHV